MLFYKYFYVDLISRIIKKIMKSFIFFKKYIYIIIIIQLYINNNL